MMECTDLTMDQLRQVLYYAQQYDRYARYANEKAYHTVQRENSKPSQINGISRGNFVDSVSSIHRFCIAKSGNIQEVDIELVMGQTNASYGQTLEALQKHNGDIVNAIMDLTNY